MSITAAGKSILSESGFSVMEVIVSLGITSALLTAGIPSLLQTSNGYRVQTAINSVEKEIRQARTHALQNGARIILQTNEAGSAVSIGIDYEPFSDDFVPDDTLSTKSLPDKMTLNIHYPIVITSRGETVDEWGYPSWVWVQLNDESYPVAGISVSPSLNMDTYVF